MCSDVEQLDSLLLPQTAVIDAISLVIYASRGARCMIAAQMDQVGLSPVATCHKLGMKCSPRG
jgi:hypothetical protein